MFRINRSIKGHILQSINYQQINLMFISIPGKRLTIHILQSITKRKKKKKILQTIRGMRGIILQSIT